MMNKKMNMISVLKVAIILLSVIVTIYGICSFHTEFSYNTVNQYGESIKMWGAGVYAHDSYFKTPIFIDSDFTILFFMIPLAVITFIKTQVRPVLELHIQNLAVLSLLLYYSTSIALGVTYNYLQSLYIALFGACFYCVCFLFAKLHAVQSNQKEVCQYHTSKGIKAFLVISGIALCVAWFPDIMTSLVNGTSLDLIEVDITEITYVLDMGIGIMLPIQTIFQLMAGISIPIPVLITKVMIFVVLALCAAFFEHQLKRETRYIKA